MKVNLFVSESWYRLFAVFTLMITAVTVFTFYNSFASSILWQYHTIAGEVDTSPAIADLDGDGALDVVVCTTAGRVLAIDMNGRRQWRFNADQTISNPPTIMSTESHPKVVVVTNPGKVICLAGKSGSQLWTYTLPGNISWGSTAIAAGDVNGNGEKEIIIGDDSGHVFCLDQNGAQLWSVDLKCGVNTAPALVDLDGDGQLEILLGTTVSPLVCLSNRGKKRWQLSQGEAVGSSPVVTDIDGDRQADILLGLGDGLALLNWRGQIAWQHPMKMAMHDAIAVADLDDDARIEIVAVDLFGHVVCLKPDGQLKWSANVEQRVRRSPAIADIDGDSVPEVIIGGYSSALHIFDPDGNLKERLPLKAAMNATPSVVDFKGNGRIALICATGSDVIAFSWMDAQPKALSPVLWPEYRFDSARTGSNLTAIKTKQPRIVNIDFGNFYVGENQFMVTVENPQNKRLRLELLAHVDNAAPYKTSVTSTDSLFDASVGYTLIGQSAGNIGFTGELFEGKKSLARREKSFYIIPFVKDVADLWRALSEIKSTANILKDQSYVKDRVMLLQIKLKKLEAKTRVATTLPTLELSELRDDLAGLRKNVVQLQAMTEAAARAGSSLAAYQTNPWAPFGGVEEIVENCTAPADLSVECYSGETESAALNIANFRGEAVTVRIEPQDLRSTTDSIKTVPWRKIFSFHEMVNTPTQSLDYSADALPLLGQARTLLLPAWNLRQLWINVNASDLAPGEWQSTIRIRSLEVEPCEATAQILIKVWPIKLPAEQSLKLCHWGYVHTSVLKGQPEAALEDQVTHGTNVFVATNQFAPRATFDENGKLIGEIDFSDHDDYVQRHSHYGLILFFNYQVSLKGPAKRFSRPWNKAYESWLEAWFDHMRELGLNYQDYALYPIDEPGLREGLVDDFISYSKPIRKIDAHVHIYADPVAGASLNDLQRMAPYVDIWCPNRNGYLLKQGAEKLAYLKSTGKTVWTYECADNAKHQSPLGYYRAQAWLVWYHGLTGIGFWSYCTSRYDPWYVPVGGRDYLLIYQGDGVVTSKRWEAIRDGIEDFGLLEQLKEAIEQTKNRPESADLIAKAENVLADDVGTIAQFCGLDDEGTVPTVKGMVHLRELEDRRWQKIQGVRRKVANLLQKLSGTEKVDW